MSKKKIVPKKKTKTRAKSIDPKLAAEISFKEILIKFTAKRLYGYSGRVDQTMDSQLKRLQAELAVLTGTK